MGPVYFCGQYIAVPPRRHVANKRVILTRAATAEAAKRDALERGDYLPSGRDCAYEMAAYIAEIGDVVQLRTTESGVRRKRNISAHWVA